MTLHSELLIAHGFKKKETRNDKDTYKGDTPKDILTSIKKQEKTFDEKIKELTADKKETKDTDKIAKLDKDIKETKTKKTTFIENILKDADHDELEVTKDQIMLVDYPKPIKKYHLVFEDFNVSIEPIYFWALNHLKYDLGFGWIEKISDVFSASEHSAFWGAATSRLGLAQDKAQSYMALLGQFIRKDLWQLVRDIRWLTEKIDYHEQAIQERDDDFKKDAATVVLKGTWADLVDGKLQGQQVTPNIFGMAQQVGYTLLPDLFFTTHAKTREDVSTVVDKLDTTGPVKSVLKRKLEEFAVWQERNYEEQVQRKKFELQYLRQHYNILRMYIQWVKPYLLHIERLRANTEHLGSANIISAFEGSMISIEILGAKLPSVDNKVNTEVHSCIVLTLEYRTKPQLQGAFTQQTPGYHQGPIHVGELTMTWRAYSWTSDQISHFKQMREQDDFSLLRTIDSSIGATMDAMGDDLWTYLEEANEKDIKEKEKKEDKKDKKKEQPTPPSMMQPFKDVGKGATQLFKSFFPNKDKGNEKKGPSEAEVKSASKEAKNMMYFHYKNFKKAHGMTHW